MTKNYWKEQILYLTLPECTARMTLFQLAAAGHDDAKDVAQKLNLTREDTQDSKTVKADEDDLFINSVVMEVRYVTNGKIAKESSSRNH